jgi:hypothetical protein
MAAETLVIANRDDLDLNLIRQEWSPVATGEEVRTAWLEDVFARLVSPGTTGTGFSTNVYWYTYQVKDRQKAMEEFLGTNDSLAGVAQCCRRPSICVGTFNLPR